MSLLADHLNACERNLLAKAAIPSNSGHSLHKGTPREFFVREFLQSHLSDELAIGSGEIIDCNSKAGEQRNQIDIIIYKKNYPRLDFGGGIHAFLAESVIATIEVKSVLDAAGLEQSIQTASRVKALDRNIINTFQAGYRHNSILTFVVAYDGPAKIETVHGWIPGIHKSLGINLPDLSPDRDTRIGSPWPSIDGVYILGKGILQCEVMPFMNAGESDWEKCPNLKWTLWNSSAGNLVALFLCLTAAMSGVEASWVDLNKYYELTDRPAFLISGYSDSSFKWSIQE